MTCAGFLMIHFGTSFPNDLCLPSHVFAEPIAKLIYLFDGLIVGLKVSGLVFVREGLANAVIFRMGASPSLCSQAQ